MKNQNHHRDKVLLNPNISRQARLLWAILRQFEQEGTRDLKIDELSDILDFGNLTVMSYLDELRRKQCLRMEWISGTATPATEAKPNSGQENTSWANGASTPHLN